ncbi:MAG: M67 family metallopeptidase [Deltaproteobacteria bacterium]|jgi:proteasome lid subunit RPN8/RPN11|nr:M67 family metallopeptidase [Deltaproteobacteria bacterium]
MKITLTRDAFQTMVDHARQQFPLEACGLIAGGLEGDLKAVTRAVPLKNVHQSRERFAVDPREQLLAIKALREEGLTPLGNYHSHPETPARPSGEDLSLYRDPKASYLILSLAERQPVLKSFGLADREGQTVSVEEELVIM